MRPTSAFRLKCLVLRCRASPFARHNIGSDTHVPPSLGFPTDFHTQYCLKELIGSGTFADVYQAGKTTLCSCQSRPVERELFAEFGCPSFQAEHRETKKQVAVKILPKAPRVASISPAKAMGMIENEVKAMRILGSSLNVVRLEGVYETNSDVIMVYAPGRSEIAFVTVNFDHCSSFVNRSRSYAPGGHCCHG